MIMEITSLTFNIKDVITIVLGIASLLGLYYALKRAVEKVSSDLENLEDKQEKDHQSIVTAMKEHKEDSDKKEAQIYKRIDDIREEQKSAHEKLEVKIDAMADNLVKMSGSLAELTGYIKAKKE